MLSLAHTFTHPLSTKSGQGQINRDPIAEHGGLNLHTFLDESSPNSVDAFGLRFGPGSTPGMPTGIVGSPEPSCGQRIYDEVNADYCGGAKGKPPSKLDPSDRSCRQAHCIANCRIKRECTLGGLQAALGSWYKEHIKQGHGGWKDIPGGWGSIPWFYDGWNPNDSPGDMQANKFGRKVACDKSKTCEELCKAGLGTDYPASNPGNPGDNR